MSDSPTQTTSAEIPPCPPLIDILFCLRRAEIEFFGNPDSSDSKWAIELITHAAHASFSLNRRFTKEYALHLLGATEPAILDRIRSLIENVDLPNFGDLAGHLERACRRINLLRGISTVDLQLIIDRCVRGRTLDAQQGAPENLNHIAEKLRELNSDGTAEEIWRKVWCESPLFRTAWHDSHPDRKDHSGSHGSTLPADSTATPAVSKPGKLILAALLKTYPTLRTIEEIANGTHYSERTVGSELKTLITAGFACRPSGKGKGATLTPSGKTLAESFASDK